MPHARGDILVNRFRIVDIKEGGMAWVYIAEDLEKRLHALTPHSLENRIAIKAPKLDVDSSFIALFHREAKLWINLEKHNNIVNALFVREVDGIPHLFMEYANHGNLRAWIQKQSRELLHLLVFALHICRGLGAAHKSGLKSHGDIKPENILLCLPMLILTSAELEAKVSDFGVSRSLSLAATSPTPSRRSGDRRAQRTPPMGSSRYKAPESLLDADSEDVISDVFSVGVLMFEMLTRRMPFRDGQYDRSPEFGTVPPDTPKALKRIIERCLAIDRGNRYRNFQELEIDLRATLAEVDKAQARLASMVRLDQTVPNPENLLARADSLSELEAYEEASPVYEFVLALTEGQRQYQAIWGCPLG